MADIAWHLLGLAHGIGAGVVCFGAFFLCGLAVTPGARDREAAQLSGFDASPAVLGAAVYVILCWFGIRLKIPISTTIVVFSGLAAVLVAGRFRAVAAGLRARGAASRRTLEWTLAFALLYALGYVFFTPSVTGEFLPLSTYRNQDLHFYLTFTRYLQVLGPSNVAGYSFLNYVYLQTPAVFYTFGFFSVFFGREPLWAAMPLQFACTGLIGLFVARLSHAVFRIPRVWAVAIGCVLVSGPFFRYVEGNYFLSTLMSLPVLLHLLWSTASGRPGRRLLDLSLVVRFGAHYVLLLFMYPSFLVAGLALQVVILGLVAVASIQSDPDGMARWAAHLKQAGRSAAASAVACGALVAMVPGHFGWSIEMARYLSRPGVAGWPRDLISPLALFGVPGHFDLISVGDPARRPWAIGALSLIAVGLAGLYFRRHRRNTTVAERTFAGFAAGTLLAYCAYFLLVGPTYQQWKFASYFPLPMTAVVLAGGLRLLASSRAGDRVMATARGRRLATWLVAAVAGAFVGGNVLVHAFIEPPLQRWEAGLRNLAHIDEMRAFQELDVSLDEGGTTMLAAYFIRTKTLHMVNLSYFPSAPVELERVSRWRPYLVQHFGCEGAGHSDTVSVAGVGCLLLAPPSVAFDTSYPFNRTFLPIALQGLSRREPWGRWNQSTTAHMTFSADAQRAPIYRDAFVNLLVAPYRLPGLASRRLVLSWGTGREAETRLADREWLSLPLQPGDWAGGPTLCTLGVSVTMPDAVPPRAVDPQSLESRPIAVSFEDVSFSATPRGRVLAPAGGAGR
jgi:hypothetical protein